MLLITSDLSACNDEQGKVVLLTSITLWLAFSRYQYVLRVIEYVIRDMSIGAVVLSVAVAVFVWNHVFSGVNAC